MIWECNSWLDSNFWETQTCAWHWESSFTKLPAYSGDPSSNSTSETHHVSDTTNGQPRLSQDQQPIYVRPEIGISLSIEKLLSTIVPSETLPLPSLLSPIFYSQRCKIYQAPDTIILQCGRGWTNSELTIFSAIPWNTRIFQCARWTPSALGSALGHSFKIVGAVLCDHVLRLEDVFWTSESMFEFPHKVTPWNVW